MALRYEQVYERIFRNMIAENLKKSIRVRMRGYSASLESPGLQDSAFHSDSFLNWQSRRNISRRILYGVNF